VLAQGSTATTADSSVVFIADSPKMPAMSEAAVMPVWVAARKRLGISLIASAVPARASPASSITVSRALRAEASAISVSEKALEMAIRARRIQNASIGAVSSGNQRAPLRRSCTLSATRVSTDRGMTNHSMAWLKVLSMPLPRASSIR